MVTYVKTKSIHGWERHNVSTSKEKNVYKKRLQKRNRRIDIQKNRRCALSGAILYEKSSLLIHWCKLSYQKTKQCLRNIIILYAT